jgi:hypothetical protein
MVQKLKTAKVTITMHRDQTDLETLFAEGAITAVPRFVETTGVGKKLTEEPNEGDSWDIDRLDRDIDNEGTVVIGG